VPPADIFTLDIILAADITPGIYTITVTGQGGGITQNVDITLTVKTLIYIPSPVYGSGNSVEIPISITNSNGLAGYQITLTYDPSILRATGVTTGTLTEDWTLMANTEIEIEGQITIGGYEPMLQGLLFGSGTISVIQAEIIGEVPEEGMPLILGDVLVSDGFGEDIPSTSQDGVLLEGHPGDLNLDGDVNIFDVILCLRIALGMDVIIQGNNYDINAYPGWLVNRADMNGDDSVNIFDVIKLLRIALNMD
jgi:hypothetical protein